tara:strand:- start:89 stop:646 length:558 start_codon:yes stop_codon:yes gene_type:complete
MDNDWKSVLISKIKYNLQPKIVIAYLKSSPFKSSLVVALFFSYIYTNARINARYDMVGLDAPVRILNSPNTYSDGDGYMEYDPPEGTLCRDIANEAKVNKFIIKDAYLKDYLYLKYPDFGEKTNSEKYEIVSPIFDRIGDALEDACKREARKIAPKGWWYSFVVTTLFNMGMISIGRYFVKDEYL